MAMARALGLQARPASGVPSAGILVYVRSFSVGDLFGVRLSVFRLKNRRAIGASFWTAAKLAILATGGCLLFRPNAAKGAGRFADSCVCHRFNLPVGSGAVTARALPSAGNALKGGRIGPKGILCCGKVGRNENLLLRRGHWDYKHRPGARMFATPSRQKSGLTPLPGICHQ
jgi:hypothetical protein